MLIILIPSVLTYVLGSQKNRLIETVLSSTNNIYLGWEIPLRTLNSFQMQILVLFWLAKWNQSFSFKLYAYTWKWKFL